ARPYKKAWSTEDAIALLEKETGEHFDPGLVPKFIDALPMILAIQTKYQETDIN
ncbi:MAG: hypothetical protein HKP55_14245, partial [Gammaproteobacteria bacterium]|nr:hypothetical protein [Gammaproteobacteria bacterium]